MICKCECTECSDELWSVSSLDLKVCFLLLLDYIRIVFKHVFIFLERTLTQLLNQTSNVYNLFKICNSRR